MKALSDFLAIILFFAVYLSTHNIIWATAVMVIIGIIQALYFWHKQGHLQTMQWINLILIVGFGGATILLRDGSFIMLKTTVLSWLMALLIIISQLMGKNGLKLLLGKELTLPETVWRNLAYAWFAFFLFMGGLNLIIAYPFTPEREAFWVNFKFWGYLPIMLVFSIIQGFYVFRHLPQDKK